MRFDERFLDELKSRLRPSDVIGKTVPLKRQGREYVGLSPFNKEKSPSFFVNDEKGFFHDFSSGKHGDIIGFLQETERLSFREAVEKLAADAGMQLPAEDPVSREREQRRLGLQDWLEEAAKWFEAQLRRPQGEAARGYLDRRGLPEGEWGRFRLGLAPAGRTGLKDHLIAKGASAPDLIEAGLLIAPEEGGMSYDRFRDRIIFPITDARGRVISFGGRALDPHARAKYLNGPESPLFHKGSNLYGLAEARKLLHLANSTSEKSDQGIVVVEGYLDCIACQRAGIPAVAPLGTALTEEQIQLLWRSDPLPRLFFDNDPAGLRAAWRSMDRVLPILEPDRSLHFGTLSGGKDPDDVMREHGAVALRAQMGKTVALADALFEREAEAISLRSTPEAVAGLKVRLRILARAIRNKDVSEQYLSFMMDRLYSRLRELRFPASSPRPAERVLKNDLAGVRKKLDDKVRAFNASIALGAVMHPDWAHEYVEEFRQIGFGDPRLNLLISPIVNALLDDAKTQDDVKDYIRKAGAKSALENAYLAVLHLELFRYLDTSNNDATKASWHRSVQVALELAVIERELEERANEVKSGREIANPAYHVARGRELGAKRRELFHAIHWGEGTWMVAENDDDAELSIAA